jgi:hypothetical protein
MPSGSSNTIFIWHSVYASVCGTVLGILYLLIMTGAGIRSQFVLVCCHVILNSMVISALLAKETTEAPRFYVAPRHLVGTALERREGMKDGKRICIGIFYRDPRGNHWIYANLLMGQD